MAVFAYQGVNKTGKSTKGTMDGESAKAVKAALRRDGIFVTEIVEAAEAARRAEREIDFAKMFRRVSALDIALTTRQLATLLRAGIPLVEALTALIDQLDNPDMRHAFTDTRDKVNEGSSLADALEAHPKIFQPLFVNMVAAGEASGTLEAVLARLADFLESRAKLTSRVGSALAYPVVMGIMAVLVIIIMMVVVVPKVTGIFEGFGQTLPWYTRVLIFTSDLMSGWSGLVVLILTIVAIVLFFRWKKSPKGQAIWDEKILKLPLFGPLLIMVSVSRFARTLSTLLKSGVPVLQAMDITKNVLGNSELEQVIEDARDSVREGENIADPLKRSGKFPPIVVHMIAIGERSGQLEEMLEHVAEAYDAQVEAKVDALTSLLEPLMIIVMGGISAAIAFSILMPLMQINEFVQ